MGHIFRLSLCLGYTYIYIHLFLGFNTYDIGQIKRPFITPNWRHVLTFIHWLLFDPQIVVILREQKKSCVEQKIYRAEADSLPAVFLDGTWETGPSTCPVRIIELTKGSLIHINLCYIRTKIVIRQVGKYLTFHIKIPEDIVSSSSRGLCVAGCPKRERIDFKEVLSSTAAQIQTRTNSVKYSKRHATELCTNSDVQGFYLDSCVFDLMFTGDTNFTAAAKSALEDAFFLDPEGTVHDLKIYNSTVTQNYQPRTTHSQDNKSRASNLLRPFFVSIIIPVLFCFIESRTYYKVYS